MFSFLLKWNEKCQYKHSDLVISIEVEYASALFLGLNKLTEYEKSLMGPSG